MARAFTFAAVLIAVAVSVSADPSAVPGSWHEIVTLDCNGGVHWGNSQQLWRTGLDASLLKNLWDFVVQRVQARVKCHCPSLTDLQVQTHFNGSFASILQWFDLTKTNPATGLPNCQNNAATAFTTDVAAQGDGFSVPLPTASCSYESWAAGEPCLVQMPMPGLGGVTFQFAFDHCANPAMGLAESNVPYVSVTCQGPACADFMVPCNNNNDCSENQQCSPLFGSGDTTSVLNWLRTALPKGNLWIPGAFVSDDNPHGTCTSSSGATIGDDTFSSWVLNSLIGIVMPYTQMGALSLPITNLQFCGAGTWHVGGLITVLAEGCTTMSNQAYGVTTYDCQLSAWDGILYDGSSALNVARKTGTAFAPFAQPGQSGLTGRTTSPNVDDGEPINLVSLPCGDGSDAPNDQLGLLLNSPGVAIKAALPVVHAVQSAVVKVAATMADCRNGGTPLAGDQIDIRFNPGFATVLNAAVDHTPAHPFVPPESALADPYTAAYNWFDPFTPDMAWPNPIVHLPDTCTLQSWLTDGSCGFQYDGLKTLLNRDVTIRFGAYACPAAPHTFGLHAECVGNGCADVVQPYMTRYCRQDSDCTGGRMCQQFPNLGRANYISDAFWNVFASGDLFYVTLSPPQSNFNYFSNMNAAQQAATVQQLYKDLINATNIYGDTYYNGYWIDLDMSVIDQLNTNYFWGTYPSFTIYVKPNANNYNTLSAFWQSSGQWLATMPVGQYVSYNYPAYGNMPEYVKCPSNGLWVLDPTQCSPPDTCDTEPALEADLLTFILTATGQPLPSPPIDPTSHFHGYCATVFNNITSSSVNAWAATQWGYDATRANPKVIVLPAVSAWAPPVPPAPVPPTPDNGGNGLSDSAKAGVVTASVLGGALGIGAIFYCCIRKKPGQHGGAGIESSSANQPLAQSADRVA